MSIKTAMPMDKPIMFRQEKNLFFFRARTAVRKRLCNIGKEVLRYDSIIVKRLQFRANLFLQSANGLGPGISVPIVTKPNEHKKIVLTSYAALQKRSFLG
jgi:hypothetical protein